MLAVDPTSRRSGGALLGDRARIEVDPADASVFIRSTAAGDRLGGLAPATRAAAGALAAAFDVVVIETVGVGQSETEVADVADTVAVVVQPGSGDVLQFLKAGIMEVPDVLVVTKADLGRVATRARGRPAAPRSRSLGAPDTAVVAVSSVAPADGDRRAGRRARRATGQRSTCPLGGCARGGCTRSPTSSPSTASAGCARSVAAAPPRRGCAEQDPGSTCRRSRGRSRCSPAPAGNALGSGTIRPVRIDLAIMFGALHRRQRCSPAALGAINLGTALAFGQIAFCAGRGAGDAPSARSGTGWDQTRVAEMARIVLSGEPLVDGPTALRPWRDSDIDGARRGLPGSRDRSLDAGARCTTARPTPGLPAAALRRHSCRHAGAVRDRERRRRE